MAKLKISSERTLKDLTNISKTIAPLAKQLLGQNGFTHIELLSAWPQIVGEQIAKYSLPHKLIFSKNQGDNGTLTIMTLSGAFAMEIQQNEGIILQKINAFFGYNAVGKIRIIQNSNPEDFLQAKKPYGKVKKTVVSAEEEAYITELIKDISDEKLRNTLENLGKAVFSDNK
ncbi:MAG: DUF721 domain-containing protein [Alphaproteobacteria bacterium]|nr:DUF721 domain-containing protein [Alphaproteobacteria bacterium]